MEGKKIVLAIDDNVQQLNEFKSILVPKYDLRVVKSAAEAISFLYKAKADVILLDIEMPNISGYEFLDDIRKIPSYLSTPIIVVSGNSGREFYDRVMRSAANGVLTKPVRQDELIDTIEKSLAEQS